jgi:hypothetical protein
VTTPWAVHVSRVRSPGWKYADEELFRMTLLVKHATSAREYSLARELNASGELDTRAPTQIFQWVRFSSFTCSPTGACGVIHQHRRTLSRHSTHTGGGEGGGGAVGGTGGGAVALRTEQLEPGYSDALSTSQLHRCTFEANHAEGGGGGALWVHSVDHGGEHACTQCIFRLNTATARATPLSESASSNSSDSANSTGVVVAEAVSGQGGAVYAATHSMVRAKVPLAVYMGRATGRCRARDTETACV